MTSRIEIERKKRLRAEYQARINRVIDHIEANLGRELGLEELARVACFSPYHFHRIFRALVGEPLSQFVRRIRLERAAGQLASQPHKPVTDIAIDLGFSGSAAFSRAFKDWFGTSASRWRESALRSARSKERKPKSKPGQADRKRRKDETSSSVYHDGAIHRQRRTNMNDKLRFDVEVKDLPELTVAYVRHIGPFHGVKDAFGKLMAWAGPRGLLRFPETKALAVYHDNPDITDEAKLRSSACITVPAGTPVSGEVGTMTIPGGRFAVARFEVADGEFGEAWNAFYGRWLPESGFQPDDRMCYEVYLNDFRQHPQRKHIIDICMPVKPL